MNKNLPKFFGYIRVSTKRQGDGVSPEEQKDSILRYAARKGYQVVTWFSETRTAAKRGRPEFAVMVRALKKGQAEGVIIHKVDRGTRNYRDWDELSESGFKVRIAHDDLDLDTRGGRLAADMQVVMAVDYIRNLREEVTKGIYGLLKIGFYPFPAPIGYLDRGKLKFKEPDPVMAPLVRRAFELYATGAHSLDTLTAELERLGLRNKVGKPLRKSAVSEMLNNPFYMGVIRIQRNGLTFEGKHEPIVTPSLFRRVKAILEGRYTVKGRAHDFLFRRVIRCANCRHGVYGELQKGHVYYRCHSQRCSGSSVSEAYVGRTVRSCLSRVQLTPAELAYLAQRAACLRGRWDKERVEQAAALTMRREQLHDRVMKLTDAYLDGMIDKTIFTDRKAGLLHEQASVDEQSATLEQRLAGVPLRLQRFLELAASLYSSYEIADTHEKRRLLKIVASNVELDHKTLGITLAPPFRMIAEGHGQQDGGHSLNTSRTLDLLFGALVSHFQREPANEDEEDSPVAA